MSDNNYATAQQGISKSNALSPVVIALLKGVVYQDDSGLWPALVKLQPQVRDYMTTLNLELILDEAEGYAFLRSLENLAENQTDQQSDPQNDSQYDQAPSQSRSHSTGDNSKLVSGARLIARRPLSFPVSLLLALLRKKLAEFDARGGDTRLILHRNEIAEIIRIFVADGSNETKLISQVDTNIKKIVELGFLRQIKSSHKNDESYEVRRILKAFVDAQWLSDFDDRLKLYLAKAQGSLDEVSDD